MSRSYSFVVGADIIRPFDECLYLYIYFDVIKVVCNAHERENEVRRYILISTQKTGCTQFVQPVTLIIY